MSGVKIIESGQRFIILSKAAAPRDDAAQRERLAAFLEARMPQDTAKRVARGTGTPVATVYKWLTQEAFPNGHAVIRLVRFFGIGLLIEVFGFAADEMQAMVERDAKRRALEGQLAALDGLGR